MVRMEALPSAAVAALCALSSSADKAVVQDRHCGPWMSQVGDRQTLALTVWTAPGPSAPPRRARCQRGQSDVIRAAADRRSSSKPPPLARDIAARAELAQWQVALLRFYYHRSRSGLLRLPWVLGREPPTRATSRDLPGWNRPRCAPLAGFAERSAPEISGRPLPVPAFEIRQAHGAPFQERLGEWAVGLPVTARRPGSSQSSACPYAPRTSHTPSTAL